MTCLHLLKKTIFFVLIFSFFMIATVELTLAQSDYDFAVDSLEVTGNITPGYYFTDFPGSSLPEEIVLFYGSITLQNGLLELKASDGYYFDYLLLLDQYVAADIVFLNYPVVQGNGDLSLKAKFPLRKPQGAGDNSQLYQIAVGSSFEDIITLSVQSEPSTGQSLIFFGNNVDNQIEYLDESVFTTFNDIWLHISVNGTTGIGAGSFSFDDSNYQGNWTASYPIFQVPGNFAYVYLIGGELMPFLDNDSDGIYDHTDNCPADYNPGQEDTYPPGGNDIGDACDCESDFTCDGDVDAVDVQLLLADFGREAYYKPCGDPLWGTCNGDFACDGDVDADDVQLLLADFGREAYYKPCPACEEGNWCAY